MGLGLAFLRDLIALKRSGALDGAHHVLEIGAQQVADSLITAPELKEAAGLFGATVFRAAPVGSENFADQAPGARPFWEALGFRYASVDLEGAALRLDLDRDAVPAPLRGAFDLVINTGTTEHVANQANAFQAIHDFTGPGGVMYHEVPAGGLIDHGLVAYQPKFFFRLCKQNDYELLHFTLTSSPPSPVPAYVHEFNQRWGGTMPETVPDYMLRVALRKRHDTPFSAPVDAAEHLIPEPRFPPLHRLRRALGRLKRRMVSGE
jgi:SAM-dependent methyltransferase